MTKPFPGTDGSLAKVNADGVLVLSSYVDPGEAQTTQEAAPSAPQFVESTYVTSSGHIIYVKFDPVTFPPAGQSFTFTYEFAGVPPLDPSYVPTDPADPSLAARYFIDLTTSTGTTPSGDPANPYLNGDGMESSIDVPPPGGTYADIGDDGLLAGAPPVRDASGTVTGAVTLDVGAWFTGDYWMAGFTVGMARLGMFYPSAATTHVFPMPWTPVVQP